MAYPYINAYQQFFDSSGDPLVDGTITFRDPDTDNLVNTYPTADDADAGTNANSNPLTLNASGAAAGGLYLNDGVKYKVILKNAAGGTEDTQDDVRCPMFSAVAIPFGGSIVFENAIPGAVDNPTFSNETDELLCTREIRFRGAVGESAFVGVNNRVETDSALVTDVFGDTHVRYRINMNGQMSWGSGAAVSDFQFARTGAGNAQFTGIGVSILTFSDQANDTGYAGITFEKNSNQKYSVGQGGPTESALGVPDSFFVYDNLAGKMRVVVKPNGATRLNGGVASPAGGSAAAAVTLGTNSTFGIYHGSGIPTVAAAIGSIYMRSDGVSCVKEVGTSTTGWRPIKPSSEVVTATNVITAEESGATFYLSSATEFVSTLPTPLLNLRYTFIISAAPSGANYTVVTDSGANIMHGLITDVNATTPTLYATARDVVTFIGGTSLVGDRLEVESDGTSWFYKAFSGGDGGITTGQT